MAGPDAAEVFVRKVLGVGEPGEEGVEVVGEEEVIAVICTGEALREDGP